MELLVGYANWVSLGVLILCQIQMINFSYQLWRHVEDDKFTTCFKIFVTCVVFSVLSSGWLLYSHHFLLS